MRLHQKGSEGHVNNLSGKISQSDKKFTYVVGWFIHGKRG